jgi:glycine/D-amino acid oxidase-like deaminating enzyme
VDEFGDAPDALALQGEIKTDVAIMGGGFVGLWTAIRIKEHAPTCEVAVLEQDICGGGASGRNGGFVLSWMSKLSSLAKLFGIQEALRIARGSELAIEEIGEFCRDHRIDADFRKGGWLWTATSTAQLNAWEALVRHCEKNGVRAFERLDPAEATRRAGSKAQRDGYFVENAAIVQPAALVWSWWRAGSALCVRIENTKVKSSAVRSR